MANRITVLIDVATDKAITSLKNLRSSINEAEGFTGKLKAGVSGLGGAFKTAATNPAVLAGAVTAAGAAALTAVNKFSDLGVAVGRFADATGMAVTPASQLMEVASDLGIETAALEGGIGKMNKAIATSPAKFEALGVAVVHAKDGTVDMAATFLKAVDAVNATVDPQKKALLAGQLFGRGWQSMSELIKQGSDTIVKSMGEVDSAKTFTDEEVKQARQYRDATKALGDVFEQLVITVGGKLAPALTTLAGGLTDVANAAAWFTENDPFAWASGNDLSMFSNSLDTLEYPLKKARDNLKEAFADPDPTGVVVGTFDKSRQSSIQLGEAVQALGIEQGYLADEQVRVADQFDMSAEHADALQDSMNSLRREYEALFRTLDADESIANLNAELDGLKTGAIEPTAAEVRNLKRDALEMLQTLNVPASVAVSIESMIDDGKWQQVEDRLNMLARMRTVSFEPSMSPVSTGKVKWQAGGGDFAAGDMVMSGERGPELQVMGSAGHTFTAGQTAAMLSGRNGGTTINLTVHAGLGADGAQVGGKIVDLLKQWSRVNGPVKFG